MIEIKNGRARSVRTEEETESLLAKDLENLTPAERATLDVILKEMQEKKDPSEKRLIDVLADSVYRTPPVDMRTFVKDPYYLGETCSTIYPKLLDDLVELFGGDYTECIFCLAPDTTIPLLDGTTATIEELAGKWAADSKPFWVYGVDAEGRIVPAQAEAPRQTGVDDYFKVTLDDGSYFIGNARHQMVLRSGEKRMIRDMSKGDSLMPFHTELSKKGTRRRIDGYELVYDPKLEDLRYTHALVAEDVHGHIDSKKLTIHHEDFSKTNNEPQNLSPLSWKAHTQLHSKAKKEWFAKHPEARAKAVIHMRNVRLMGLEAHKKYARSARGKKISGDILRSLVISPEERSRRGFLGSSVRWQGPNAEKQRKEAADRLRARNLQGQAAAAGRLSFANASPEGKERKRAAVIARNKAGTRTDVTVEAIEAAIAAGAATLKAVTVKLNCSMGKLRTVLVANKLNAKILFGKNHYVVSIEPCGAGPVYCMTVPRTTNFAICTKKPDGSVTRQGVFSSNTGSIGYGKTFVSSIGLCRVLYEISCLRDPHGSYGMSKDTNISIVALSVNESLAKKVVFENIVTKLKASPYFQENFPFDATKEELRFPNNIWVAPRATTDTSALGLSTISAIMDETNFLPNKRSSGGIGEENRAETLYASIKRRMKSRFERQGKLPGMLFIVSSKRTNDDFTAKRIKESMTDSSIFTRDYATWHVKPEEYFKAKRFWVLCGNADIGSKILEGDEVERYRDTPPEGTVVIDVPEEFRRDFELDLEGAIRDIAGIASVSIRPFIQRREKIKEAIDPVLEHPLTTLIYDMSRPGQFMWDRMVANRSERSGPGRADFQRLRPRLNPAAARHAHLDIGLKHDALGLTVAHISGWRDVVRRAEDGREFTDRAPVYVVDLFLRVIPPIGGEIVLSEVRHLLYDLTAHGYMITSITADQFQSSDSLQAFAQRGYRTQLISVDATPNAYDCLKAALYENRVRMYHYQPVIDELITLQEGLQGNRRKIDHPAKSSKDVADSFAAVVYTLSQQKLVEPVPILKSGPYVGDPWMDEQRQSVYAGNAQAGNNSTLLPFMIGNDDDEWKSPWRP